MYNYMYVDSVGDAQPVAIISYAVCSYVRSYLAIANHSLVLFFHFIIRLSIMKTGGTTVCDS